MDPYVQLVQRYKHLKYYLENVELPLYSSVVTTTRQGNMDFCYRKTTDDKALPVRVPVKRFVKGEDYTDVIKSLIKKDKRRIDAVLYVKNKHQTKIRKWR